MPSPALAGTTPTVSSSGATNAPFLFFMQPGHSEVRLLPYDLPSQYRSSPGTVDAILRSTIYHEGMWANAVNIALTQVAVKAFEIVGDVPLHIKRSHDILLQSEGGNGWHDLMLKGLQDFTCTNNGMFIEIERENKSPYSRVRGLWVLDSLRCYRTGNSQYPVVYTDTDGVMHRLENHQVIMLSDMPSPDPYMRGIGWCAAARAYKAILKMVAIERYYYEKISGAKPQSINFLNNLTSEQLAGAIDNARAQNKAKGFETYMGAMVVSLPGDSLPQLVTIDFASLPDNFNREYETRQANVVYAAANGYSVDELEPQTGQALGVGAQSQTQMQRDKRKGLAALEMRLVHQLHNKVLPQSVTYAFVSRDFSEEKQQAELKQAIVAAYEPLLANGTITKEENRQLMAEEKVLPKSFLEVDQPDRSLTDTERADNPDATSAVMPEGEGQAESKSENESKPETQPNALVAALTSSSKEVKVKESEIAALVEGELAAARRIFKEVLDRDARPRPKAKPGPVVTSKEAALVALAQGQRLPASVLREYGLADVQMRRVLRGLGEDALPLITLKHLPGVHDQSSHGGILRRRAKKINKRTGNKNNETVLKRRLALKILSRPNSPENLRKAALRALPKEEREKYRRPRKGSAKPAPAGGNGSSSGNNANPPAPKPKKAATTRPAPAPAPKAEPKPKALGPQGTPVSQALKLPSGKWGTRLKRTLEAIDKVHGDGALKQTGVGIINSTRINGQYRTGTKVSAGGSAFFSDIQISSNKGSDHPELTLAHEIGHFLDYEGLSNAGPTRGYPASERGNISPVLGESFDKWYSKINTSKTINALRQSQTTGRVKVKKQDGSETEVSHYISASYFNYLLSRREIWARAYAQYIAVKSNDPVLMEQLRKQQSEGILGTQWPDDDFEPIMNEMDNIFKTMGWVG